MLGSFLMKAAMCQISSSGTSIDPKLGIPVMVMPFLITQNSSAGELSLAISLRSGGSGCIASANLAQPTPGPPWQVGQPRSENARAPACTVAESLSLSGALSVAWRSIEASRTLPKAHLKGPDSPAEPATL